MIDSWDFSPFPRYSRLVLEVTSDGYFAVAEPFEIELREGDFEVIKPGFMTDLASIPAPARPIFRTWGSWTKPAVLHDYHYRMKNVTRDYADKIFLDGLETQGVGWLARNAMWAGVRGFGWFAWL